MEVTVENQTKVKVIQQTKTSPLIAVSADRLWEIMGPGFSQVATWSRAVDHAETSGIAEFDGASCSNRACDLNASGFNKISETIIEYNESEKLLGYTVDTGLPGFVVYMVNNWRVVPVGKNHCRAEMTITMKLKPFLGAIMGPMFKMNVNKVLNDVIEDLKIYAETGEISEAKKKRIVQLARKAA